MTLQSEGIKCNSCILAVVLNSAASICSDENKENKNLCEELKKKATEGNLSVGEYLNKIKEKCKTEICKYELDELTEFFKEEYEPEAD
jgi:UDP-N-acetylmuramyl pentapeptide synthase